MKAIDVMCPRCGAGVGKRCVGQSPKDRICHRERRKRAETQTPRPRRRKR